MRSDRWQDVHALFQRALERDADDRIVFVREVCAGRPELEREVEALLSAHQEAGSFLETSPEVERAGEPDPPPLRPGARLGPYEVTGWIGSGGMGQVYRARDTRLERDVALKVLPPASLADPDRLARFEREARVLASLDHPGIAAIHGIEETASAHALVLELVEGPTLADRVAEGPIPLDEVLPAATQIAEALEVAHDQGIVHRDLKPANIKVRPDGVVKILDFGLAKALDRSPDGDPTRSPTLTTAARGAGVVLGTAAYMSPEQARGRPVDKRTDVWAFGCLLFEMLTGQRAFDADSVADTTVALLTRDVPWDRLGPVPPAIRQLLRRCLDKGVRTRLRDIGEARIACERALHDANLGVAPDPEPGPPGSISMRRLLVAAGLTAMGVGIGYGLWGRTPVRTAQPTAFSVSMPAGVNLAAVRPMGAAVSPDGRHLVFVGERDGVTRLYHRPMDTTEARPMGGTDGARRPFFSPDGRSVGFYLDDTLRRVPLAGGAAVTICTLPPIGGVRDGAYSFATWAEDDTIWFGGRTIGIHQVAARGGVPRRVTSVDAAAGEMGHWMPQLIPGGRGVLYGINRGPLGLQIGVFDKASGEHRVLVNGGRLAYGPGHLLYQERPPRDIGPPTGRLLAVAFDAEALQIAGPPVTVLEDLELLFPIGSDGTLVYVPRTGPVERYLVWLDGDGREERAAAAPGMYQKVRLSPDGRRVAVAREGDIWVLDLQRGSEMRLTTDPGIDSYPVWSSRGDRIVFGSARGDAGGSHFTLFSVRSDGSGEPELMLADPSRSLIPTAWEDDDQRLMVQHFHDGDWRLGSVDLRTEPRWEPLMSSPGLRPELSPDGEWLAYASTESGVSRIYLHPFPDVEAGRWTISTGRAVDYVWSADGRRIFYRDIDAGVISSVRLDAALDPPVAAPEVVMDDPFYQPQRTHHFDVAPDGRFLVIKTSLGLGGGLPYQTDRWTAASQRLRVVQHWIQNLARRVPVD